MDGSLLGAAPIVTDGSADGGVEAAIASDPRFVGPDRHISRAGRSSMGIGAYQAERDARRNERLEHHIARRRGHAGTSDAKAVIAQMPVEEDTSSIRPSDEVMLAGAAGKHSGARSRHDKHVLPNQILRRSASAPGANGRYPPTHTSFYDPSILQYDPNAGVLAKALVEQSTSTYDALDLAVDDAEASYSGRREAHGTPGFLSPSTAAGVASRRIERHHYASGDLGHGMSGDRQLLKKSFVAPPGSPDAQTDAEQAHRMNVLPGARAAVLRGHGVTYHLTSGSTRTSRPTRDGLEPYEPSVEDDTPRARRQPEVDRVIFGEKLDETTGEAREPEVNSTVEVARGVAAGGGARWRATATGGSRPAGRTSLPLAMDFAAAGVSSAGTTASHISDGVGHNQRDIDGVLGARHVAAKPFQPAVELMPATGMINPQELMRKTGPGRRVDSALAHNLERGTTAAATIFGDDESEIARVNRMHAADNGQLLSAVAALDGAHGITSQKHAVLRVGRTWMDSVDGVHAFTPQRNLQRRASTVMDPSKHDAPAYAAIFPSAADERRRRSVTDMPTFDSGGAGPDEASWAAALGGTWLASDIDVARPLSTRFDGAYGKSSRQLAETHQFGRLGRRRHDQVEEREAVIEARRMADLEQQGAIQSWERRQLEEEANLDHPPYLQKLPPSKPQHVDVLSGEPTAPPPTLTMVAAPTAPPERLQPTATSEAIAAPSLASPRTSAAASAAAAAQAAAAAAVQAASLDSMTFWHGSEAGVPSFGTYIEPEAVAYERKNSQVRRLTATSVSSERSSGRGGWAPREPSPARAPPADAGISSLDFWSGGATGAHPNFDRDRHAAAAADPTPRTAAGVAPVGLWSDDPGKRGPAERIPSPRRSPRNSTAHHAADPSSGFLLTTTYMGPSDAPPSARATSPRAAASPRALASPRASPPPTAPRTPQGVMPLRLDQLAEPRGRAATTAASSTAVEAYAT